MNYTSGLRKVGHFLAYAVLFFAYARAWRWHLGKSRLKAVLLALAICFLISTGDESRQAMYSSRTGTPRDVVLDMSGALTCRVSLVSVPEAGRPGITPWGFPFF